MHCKCYTRYKSNPIHKKTKQIVKTEIRLLLEISISRIFRENSPCLFPCGAKARLPCVGPLQARLSDASAKGLDTKQNKSYKKRLTSYSAQERTIARAT